MLDAHEQGPAVGAPGDAGDLALFRTHQEAADLPGHRVAHQHLVVALACEPLGVGVVAVGLDPQHAVAVEGDAVGGVEHVVRVDVLRAGVGVAVHRGVSRHHVQVPGEARGHVVAAVRPPAHDLAVNVAGAGIGPAHGSGVAARVGLLAAVLVVGEGAVDLGLPRIRRHPFGTVHGGGLHRRGGDARVNADLGHGGHAGGLGSQLQPLATPAVGEPGHVELARFQQIGVVPALDVAAVAHELVKELATLVVAHVDHHLPVGRQDDLGVFVLEAAEGGTLLRRRPGVQRIDFDDVPRAVRLVGVPGDVEAFVGGGPGIAPVLGLHAVPPELGADLQVRIARREVAVKVLLAGEIGAPRGAAVAAIVPGAEAAGSRGIGGCLEQIMAPSRPGDFHRAVRRDPAVVRRVLDDGPLAVRAGDLQHGHAVAGLALAHVVGVPRLAGTGAAEDDAEIHVLVVDRQHVPAPVAEERHAVVVVAERQLLAGSGAAGLLVELHGTGPQGIAPLRHHVPRVSLGNGDRVEAVGGHRLETEAVGAGKSRERLQHPGAHDERRGREGGAAAQESAPGEDLPGQSAEIGLHEFGMVLFVELLGTRLLPQGHARIGHFFLRNGGKPSQTH